MGPTAEKVLLLDAVNLVVAQPNTAMSNSEAATSADQAKALVALVSSSISV